MNKIAGSLGIQFKKVTIPQIEDVAFTRINYSFNQLKDQRPEKNVSAKLKAQAGDILEDFSKDELVEKLLAVELKKLDKDSVKDLNADEKADYGKSSGSRGRGGYGGNRGGGGRRSGDGGGKFNRRGKGGGGESGGNFKKKDTGKKKRRRTHYNS